MTEMSIAVRRGIGIGLVPGLILESTQPSTVPQLVVRLMGPGAVRVSLLGGLQIGFGMGADTHGDFQDVVINLPTNIAYPTTVYVSVEYGTTTILTQDIQLSGQKDVYKLIWGDKKLMQMPSFSGFNTITQGPTLTALPGKKINPQLFEDYDVQVIGHDF